LVRKHEGKRLFGTLGIDVNIILKHILNNRIGKCGLDSFNSE
jgi:hypothetical protein